MDLPKEPSADAFDAFISYSRKDKAFAAKLERALERFRPPRQLAVPQRSFRVFRDEGDMTGVDYYQSIDRVLGRTGKLIVICSPNARASKYVDDEIRRFTAARGSGHVLPLLLAGLPNNEAGADQTERMAFPDALVEMLKMPLATSYLGFSERSDRVDGGAFESSWYTLLANLYGISREEVEQRERRRRRNRRFVATAIVGAVMLSLTALAAIAWMQALEADRQRHAAELQRNEAEHQRDVLHARQLAFQAQALIDTGIGDMQSRGTLLAVEAMRRWPSVEATDALQRVIRSQRPLRWQATGGGLGPGDFLAFNPDASRLVAVGDGLEPARVFDTRTGAMLFTLEPPPTRVAWSPTGALIAGAADEQVVLWSAAQGTVAGGIAQPGATALAFAPRGDRIAASADGRSVRIWRVPGGDLLGTLSRPVKAQFPEVSSLSFHPGGDLLAVVLSVGDPDDPEGFRVDIWSIERRKLRTLSFDGPVDAAAFSPCGRMLAVGIRGTVRLLDTQSWQERSRVGEDESRSMVSVTFDRAGRYVAAVGWDAPAHVWRVSDGRLVAVLEHERGASGPGRVSAVALSPNGRYAATIGDDMLRLWELEAPESDRAPLRRTGYDDHRLREFADIVAPDPGEKGGARDAENRLVMRWQGDQATLLDPDRQVERATLRYPEPILRGHVSPDGRLVALVGGTGSARVFEAASGTELEGLRQAGDVQMAALSGPASVAAFVGPDGKVRAFSTIDGRPLQDLQVPEPTHWMAFSPKGQWLLASADGTAFTALKTASRQIGARFSHDRPVSTMRFTDDEQYLATASNGDGAAHIWDLTANRELLRWHLKTNLMTVEISFTDDDRIFTFVGVEYDDRQQRLSGLWRPHELVDAACRTVNRNLTEEEWKRYFPPTIPARPTCSASGEAPQDR